MALDTPPNQHLDTPPDQHLDISGLGHHLNNVEYYRRDLRPGVILTLVAVDNPHDKHAVKVCFAGAQLGWVPMPRGQNMQVSKWLRGGGKAHAVICKAGLPMVNIIYTDPQPPVPSPNPELVLSAIPSGPDGGRRFDTLRMRALGSCLPLETTSWRSSVSVESAEGTLAWFRKGEVNAEWQPLIARGEAHAVLINNEPPTIRIVRNDCRPPAHWPRLAVPPSPQPPPPAVTLQADTQAAAQAPMVAAISAAISAALQVARQQTNQTTKPREITMTKFDAILSANKTAAIAAGTMEAGRLANNQVAKLAAKKLPMMVRGYADTPMGKLVIANIAQQAAAHFRPEDTTLAKLTGAMATQAYVELIQTMDIEGFLDEIMNSTEIKRAVKKLDAVAPAARPARK